MTKLALLACALAVVTLAPAARGADLDPAKDKAVKAVDAQIAKAKVDKAQANWRTALPKPEAVAFDPARKYFARMVTNRGTMKIQLFPDVAPLHVTNFLYLVRLGFHDGLKFHRVIPGFMAQGGCPRGNGTGDAGYEFGAEISPKVKHDKAGVLSTANRGPGTDSSQFFLTFGPASWLDGGYTIFGQVVEGLETLGGLEAVGTASGRTKDLVKVEKVTVEVE